MKNILVAEDETAIREFVVINLERAIMLQRQIAERLPLKHTNKRVEISILPFLIL